MTFKGIAIFFSVIFATFSATTSLGQGVIVPIVCDIRPCRPRPIPQPLPNALPVKSIKIDTKINGQVAVTHVEQIFRNDTQFTLEGTYFFPVPETASIVEFAIWENGKKLVGEVRSREEARRIYDEIVRRQKDPGLLEYAGKDLFQASIFPIPPNSDKILEITYSQILKADSGAVSYLYPLGTGHNLWQQQEMRGNGTPKQKFGTISGKVEIVGKDALRNVYSPSHNIDIKQKDDRSASLSFETSENDNDFQLFYGWTNDELGMSLLTYREPGKDGYFLLMVSPRDDMAERALVSKDIVFVLDTSGSMADAGKMDKARSALLFGVRTLRSGDRFNVINFAGEEHLMERGLVAADVSGKKRAEDFINKLQPNGGTNINDSLLVSLRQFDRSERPKMLVFMTDGLPTVGETKIDRIAANVAKAKNVDVRIFPFGFGYDVNTALLDKLGTDNGGISDYVQPKEDLEVKVSSFFTRVSSPVLADLELDLGPVETEGVYPRSLGDLFKGMQAVIIGRYKNDNDLRSLTVQLKGRIGKDIRTFTYSDLNFPERADENDFLPRLWASRRVGWLVEEIRNNGETKELRDEIVELGTRYGIVTPYTSYLATDGSFQAAARNARGLVNLAPTARAQMEEKSGSGAVQMSVQQNTMKLNKSLAVGDKEKAEQQVLVKNTVTNQFVGSKNFYRQASNWVDAEFKVDAKLPEFTIKFASDEYFDLANREKGLARYLAIGDEVIIVWNNRVYRIMK
jgi:Ca-activated chloride channel homolog